MSSHKPLPPAFVPISVDTAEMFSNGRAVSLTHNHRSGEVLVAAFTGSVSSHQRYTRSEAQALVTELQRVLALPVEAAA